MKHFIYCQRDKRVGAFETPFFKTEDVEHVTEGTARGLKYVKPEEYSVARDRALYFLGTFDDVTGKFELVPQEEKLLDFEDYLPKKEDVPNGK